MKLLVLGNGPFAVPTLFALARSAHQVVGVVARPARGGQGRRKPPPSPCEETARELNLPLWLPATVNCDEVRRELAALQADLLVVCDYGEILKAPTLEIARLGGINLHGSLLPKYRGAAPIQWSVFHGDTETGNTIIRMTPGLDAGPCLGQQRIAIDPAETAGQLEARMAAAGAELTLHVIDQLAAGTAQPLEQDRVLVTKAPRLTKADGRVDWNRSASEIVNQIRAMQPWPNAYTDWLRANHKPTRLILLAARAYEHEDSPPPPGTILDVDNCLRVSTGSGVLQIETLQPAGKKAMPAAAFLRGKPRQAGDRLGTPEAAT